MHPADLRLERERSYLQRVVAVAGLVPVAAGGFGVLFGAALTGDILGASGDSHYRYLSGLLLGIGLMFWSCVPHIERQAGRFRLLTLVVVIGGLARLAGFALVGPPGLAMIGALAMELVVTPLLCVWQARVARRYAPVAVAAVPAAATPASG